MPDQRRVNFVRRSSVPIAQISKHNQEADLPIEELKKRVEQHGRYSVKKTAHEIADDAYTEIQKIAAEHVAEHVAEGKALTIEQGIVKAIESNPELRADLHAVEMEQRIQKERAAQRPSNLAWYLTAKRKSNGITQEQLAKAAGVDRTTIAKFETGATRGLTSENTYAVMKALGIDFAELKKANLV